MTNNADQNRHSDQENEPAEMTFGLGAAFKQLESWAQENGLADTLAVIHITLGLDERTVGIGNLVTEMSHPEAAEILALWHANPIVEKLQQFVKTFSSEPIIRHAYAPLPNAGAADKTRRLFKGLKSRTFLLALITNPLAFTEDRETYLFRKMLRIWLVVHGAQRVVQNHYPADANISAASRFLIVGINHQDWVIIDRLLERTRRILLGRHPSFEQFSQAIGSAAEQLRHDASKTPSSQRFLNAISAIAQGNCVPITQDTGRIPIDRSFPDLETNQPRWPFFQHGEIECQAIPVGPDDFNGYGNEDDEPDPCLLVKVDPTDSPEEKTVSCRSVLIQSAELSHFLPWSWEKVLPPELKMIEGWISASLLAEDKTLRLGSALVWLAIRLSRSLALIENLEIQQNINDDWTLTPDFQYVQRRPPRRQNSWRPDNSAHDAVQPFQDEMRIALPTNVSKALTTIGLQGKADSARFLLNVWQTVASIGLEKWFHQQAGEHFPRVTSAKLGQIWSQRVFDRSGDHNLSRLLASHHNSALPGACGYGAWDIDTVERGFELSIQRTAANASRPNLIGSVLEPLESVLNNAIQQATTRLIDARNSDLVTYHNLLVQYAVMALYAGTGSRPLRDPFESATHFNFDELLVFIDDKSDENLHNGRVVPLPDKLVEVIQAYADYLERLAPIIAQRRVGLSKEIASLNTGTTTALPFFFLLDENLKWHSCSEKGLPGGILFEWPLPSNLFRHWYAQQLYRNGVNAEVIDGWMGHAERSVASYGDYSPRCWQNDAEHYRDTLNSIVDQLAFQTPEIPNKLPPLKEPPCESSSYQEPDLFGQRARQRQRRQTLRNAIRAARQDIQLFMGEKPLEELSQEDAEKLGNKMLLRENRLPHPHAAIRFAELTKVLERSGNQNYTVRKRLARIRQERSLITSFAPTALNIWPQILVWAAQTGSSLIKSQLSKFEALSLGAALLCIEKRLSYRRLLNDVVQGRNFRLIQNGKRYFFEYSEELGDHFSTPVQRHEISYKTASLLGHGVGLKKSVDPETCDCPKSLKRLATQTRGAGDSRETETLSDLLSRLCRIVEQVNLIQLPGMVAGALSERQPPTSPPLNDYLRISEGKKRLLPGTTVPDDGSPEIAANPIPGNRLRESDRQTLQNNARDYFGQITEILNQYRKPQAGKIAQQIDKLSKERAGKVPSAIVMVGYWVSDTIRKGKGRQWSKFNPFAQNTLSTYFSSLTGVFSGLAYEVNLLELDDDEITALCANMLEYTRSRSVQIGFFSRRLRDFFRWAEAYGVATPDWSELDLSDNRRQVRPGLLTEAEYLACQRDIQSMTELETDYRLILGFVLLLTYRFGLRAQEAIGLLRADWCVADTYQWVLVRNNRYREIKSVSGRRAVPLLFRLAETERTLVDQVLGRYTAIAGSETNRPILCELVNGSVDITNLRNLIPPALIQVLRRVTGNPSMILHHCRHSFYNRIAAAVLGLETPFSRDFAYNPDSSSLRSVILGDVSGTSRRSGMALARIMGHRHPRTGMKNYNHLMTDWADALTPVVHKRARLLSSAFNTKDFEHAPTYSASELPSALLFPKLSLTRIFRLLRLVSQGLSYERAGQLMQLRPDHTAALQRVFQQANANMRFKTRSDKKAWVNGTQLPNALLQSISDDGWRRLIAHAEQLSDVDPCENTVGPDLTELPFLTGRNRHLLMDQPAHCQLVNLVLDYFEVREHRYRVVARFDNEYATALLTQYGFRVLGEYEASGSGKRLQLDPFSTHLRGASYRGRAFGGLVLERTAGGIIHDAGELATAFLATGMLLAIFRSSSSDHVPPALSKS
ncbi:hypothetical protein [Marinobacter maroccanus]|nr:hypothetical protein [Marinobacter maroccanus]